MTTGSQLRTLTEQLDDGRVEAPTGGAPSARGDMTLICQNALAALNDAEDDLKRYRMLVFAVAVFVALFAIASLYVLIQFIQGDAPKGAADKVVYALPIAGTVVTGGAVAWLIRQRASALKVVKELQPRFDEKCAGVLPR